MKPLLNKKKCLIKNVAKHELRKISNQKHRKQYYYTHNIIQKLLNKKKMSTTTQKTLS